MVEFAIVAPLFVLFVFGMVEYGRMVMVQQILTNASREGARIAVLEGSTNSEVQDAVVEYCEAGRVTLSDSNVEILNESGTAMDISTAEFGDAVNVTVSVAFQDVSWLPSPMFAGNRTLHASSVMRKESTQ